MALKSHIPELTRSVVLFAGIRPKNEILEIFLYYLFLVDTGTERKNEQLVINGTLFSEGRYERVTIAEIVALRFPCRPIASRHSVLFAVGISSLRVPVHLSQHKRVMHSACDAR